jgi:8-oxo-dGTP pyrophosphatase MutT (NUDIX family)
MDILFKTEDWVFSYRVAGICVQNGKVLLQTTTGEDRSFAFPGGHVAFGETNEETLIREFKEEIGADIRVGDLKWVAEVFFPWGRKPCHQICLYYMVEGDISDLDQFLGIEERGVPLEFRWIPLDEVQNLEVYPVEAPELLQKLHEGVQHFVYKE